MSAFIEENRVRFGVEPICRTLDVSASAYYKRASGERSDARSEDERLLERDQDELHRPTTSPMGIGGCGRRFCGPVSTVGAHRVERLMREHGIQGAKRRGKPWRTTTADPSG